MAPSEIEPATFRFVAQCLNQLRHGVPQEYIVDKLLNSFIHGLNALLYVLSTSLFVSLLNTE
jgi:hypothetical protein